MGQSVMHASHTDEIFVHYLRNTSWRNIKPMQPKQQVTPSTERPELKKCMVKLKTELRNSKQEVAKLTARLESIREEKGVHVDEDLYKDLEDIMNERTEEIRNNYTHPTHSTNFSGNNNWRQ